jgi:hypothetical protein
MAISLFGLILACYWGETLKRGKVGVFGVVYIDNPESFVYNMTRDPRPATRDPRPATRDPRPATRDPYSVLALSAHVKNMGLLYFL